MGGRDWGVGEERSLRKEVGKVGSRDVIKFVLEALLLGTQRIRIVFLKASLEIMQRKIRGCKNEKLS